MARQHYRHSLGLAPASMGAAPPGDVGASPGTPTTTAVCARDAVGVGDCGNAAAARPAPNQSGLVSAGEAPTAPMSAAPPPPPLAAAGVSPMLASGGTATPGQQSFAATLEALARQAARTGGIDFDPAFALRAGMPLAGSSSEELSSSQDSLASGFGGSRPDAVARPPSTGAHPLTCWAGCGDGCPLSREGWANLRREACAGGTTAPAGRCCRWPCPSPLTDGASLPRPPAARQADDVNAFELRTTIALRGARHDLYREAHAELDRSGERQALPDCIVDAIRRTFPDPLSSYTGYQPR